MERYGSIHSGIAAAILLAMTITVLPSIAEAGCVHVPSRDPATQDLVTYSCEGGSVEDLKSIPESAERIRISRMPVGRLSNSLFSRFSNLAVLTCSECEITDIDEDAFRGLTSLQQLSLNNNKLTEVKGSWFRGLDYLTYLDLNYNNIERVDGDVFRNARDLIDLRLSGNRLLCLDLEALSRLKGLKRIYVNDNPSFGCPNAVKRFLKERNIDYEADPHWDSLSHDRVQTSEPQVPPSNPHDPGFRYSSPTLSPTTQSPPPTTYYHRRPYVPEEIPSSGPNEFTFQPPYYSTAVTRHQQLDNYRSTHQYHQRNETNGTTPIILVAGQLLPVTTTECPNRGVAVLNGGFILMMLSLCAQALSAWR